MFHNQVCYLPSYGVQPEICEGPERFCGQLYRHRVFKIMWYVKVI